MRRLDAILSQLGKIWTRYHRLDSSDDKRLTVHSLRRQPPVTPEQSFNRQTAADRAAMKIDRRPAKSRIGEDQERNIGVRPAALERLVVQNFCEADVSSHLVDA